MVFTQAVVSHFPVRSCVALFVSSSFIARRAREKFYFKALQAFITFILLIACFLS